MTEQIQKTELSESERTEAFRRLFQFCHSNLRSGENEVYSYVKDVRKLSEDTIDLFKIGSFPIEQGKIDMLAGHIGKYTAMKLGIVFIDGSGKLTSKFIHNRMVIPIYDEHGQPTAIIARSLVPEAMQKTMGISKYNNTSFKKSRTLFGLHLAKKYVQEKDEICIVEGNMDVISAYQAGMKNVVGVSNASMSRHQVLLCTRYASRVRLLFDNDEAGQRAAQATLKKYESIKQVSFYVDHVPLEYKDLDEYIKSRDL